jgi:hypothetical protein
MLPQENLKWITSKKRGEKGYMFIIGDEPYFPVIKTEQILNHVGAFDRAGTLLTY